MCNCNADERLEGKRRRQAGLCQSDAVWEAEAQKGVLFFYTASGHEVAIGFILRNLPFGEVSGNADRRGAHPFETLVQNREGHRIV